MKTSIFWVEISANLQCVSTAPLHAQKDGDTNSIVVNTKWAMFQNCRGYALSASLVLFERRVRERPLRVGVNHLFERLRGRTHQGRAMFGHINCILSRGRSRPVPCRLLPWQQQLLTGLLANIRLGCHGKSLLMDWVKSLSRISTVSAMLWTNYMTGCLWLSSWSSRRDMSGDGGRDVRLVIKVTSCGVRLTSTSNFQVHQISE